MAGGFLLQKLSSGMLFRSISRLSAHASDYARATAPVARTALEGGTTTLSNLFYGAHVVHPSTAGTSSRGIQAARYANTVPLSRADAKTSKPATGIPSIIITQVKPAYMDSVKGVKRTFSSGASKKHGTSVPETDIREYGAALNRSGTTIVGLSILTGIMWIHAFRRRSGNMGQNNSHHCSGCNCVAGVSKF